MKQKYLRQLLIATSTMTSVLASALASVLAFSSAPANAAPANTASDYHVIKKLALGGDGGWDLLTVDGGAPKMYIARSNRVMVVDMNSGKLLDEISNNMSRVHGVVTVPHLNRGFITCGGDNTVRIFDLKTRKEIAQVKTGAGPDAIIYDPASKKVFAFNHGGTTATVIEPGDGKVVAQVELGGSPELAVVDGKGRVYVNLEDKSEIAVIDSSKLVTRAHWPLSPGAEPTGLAIDVKHRRLFSGCHNQLMAIVDCDSGKVVATAPIGKGVDGAGFDPISQNAFSSNGGDGTLTVIHEDAPDKFSALQTVETQASARTLVVDTKTGQVWVVAAKFEKAPEEKEGQMKKRGAVVPDSFTAIVVGR